MIDYHKIPYVNIDRDRLTTELNKRGAYFANVAVWTLLFAYPLFCILDLLFLNERWTFLLELRTITFIISYFFYRYGTQKKWNYQLVLNLVVGTNVIVMSLICGVL